MSTTLNNLIDVNLLRKYHELSSAQITALINSAISSVYKAGGSIATVANLPALSAANEGFVYNMSADFTTTADFVEGSGKKHYAGANVAIVNTGTDEDPIFKYDILSGFVDLSGYVEKEAGKSLSTNDYSDADKAKVDGAVQAVATGSTDGTVSVDGTDVAVKGYSVLAGKVTDLENSGVSVSLATESQVEGLFN